MKNAIDWMSRPAKDIPRVFGGKPIALMGATPGRGATALAQTAWLPVLRTLGTLPWFGPRVQIPSAAKVFDAEGGLTDEETRALVKKFLEGYVDFISKTKRT
jgi:NAD(P)H-dependent FMN reductase